MKNQNVNLPVWGLILSVSGDFLFGLLLALTVERAILTIRPGCYRESFLVLTTMTLLSVLWCLKYQRKQNLKWG